MGGRRKVSRWVDHDARRPCFAALRAQALSICDRLVHVLLNLVITNFLSISLHQCGPCTVPRKTVPMASRRQICV
jgi:hypothetical protein